MAEDSWACESSEEEPRLTLACSGDACTLFLREDNEPGGIVPARGVNGGTSPSAALRHWAGILIRSPQGKPVFIIPWGHRKPLLPSQKKMLEEARRLAKEPLEKHHIFPRESGLREWFERQGIDIHKETMLLDLETHRRIHLGPNGGPWNQAWRDFQKARPRATKKEMYEHSWELLKRFKLAGFIFPYHDKPPYMLPPPIEY